MQEATFAVACCLTHKTVHTALFLPPRTALGPYLLFSGGLIMDG
jgi:hypothetical protein